MHSFEIILSDKKNELSQGNTVEIVDIGREKQINKNLESFEFSGNWETTDFPILGMGAGTVLKHSWEGRGGGEIKFRTSPTGGIIKLISENDVKEIDLYSPENGTVLFGLEAAGLAAARIKWQVFGIIAFLADGIAILWLFAMFMLLLTSHKDSSFWLVSFLIFISMIYSTSLHLLPFAGSESTLSRTFRIRDEDNRLSKSLSGDTTYFNPVEPIPITFRNFWLISSAFGDSNSYLHLIEDFSTGYAPYKYRFVPIFAVRLLTLLIHKLGVFFTIQDTFILMNVLATLFVGMGFTLYLIKFHHFSKPISLIGGMLAISSLTVTRTILFPMMEPFSMAVVLLLFWSVRSRKPVLFALASILAVTVKEVFIFSAALWFVNAPLSKKIFSKENLFNLLIAAVPVLAFMIVRVSMGGSPLEVNYSFNILAGEFPTYGKRLFEPSTRRRVMLDVFLAFGFLWLGALNIYKEELLQRTYWISVVLVVFASILLSYHVARVLGILFPLVIPAYLLFLVDLSSKEQDAFVEKKI